MFKCDRLMQVKHLCVLWSALHENNSLQHVIKSVLTKPWLQYIDKWLIYVKKWYKYILDRNFHETWNIV